MVFQSRKKNYSFILFVFLFVAIKLFTTEVSFSDDPTNILALRSLPSLNNSITLTSHLKIESYYVLLSDENGFLGQGLYQYTTKYFWWLIPVIGLVYGFFKTKMAVKSE